MALIFLSHSFREKQTFRIFPFSVSLASNLYILSVWLIWIPGTTKLVTTKNLKIWSFLNLTFLATCIFSQSPKSSFDSCSSFLHSPLPSLPPSTSIYWTHTVWQALVKFIACHLVKSMGKIMQTRGIMHAHMHKYILGEVCYLN